MKKVVLFKKESEDYHKAFLDANYSVVFVEPLQFEFVNANQLTAKLRLEEFTGIVLTSPRAVEAVSKCWTPNMFGIWNKKRVYTVGDATANNIKLLLGMEALGMTSGNSENLAKFIANDNPTNSTFLFPCGNLRTETLPDALHAAGMSVDALTVYETKENDNLKADLMQLDGSENPSCMVFFSPSGCEYIHRQLQTFSNQLSQLPHFAIGYSTASKIENLGIEVEGVAAKPCPDSLVESVHSYFSSTHS